MKQPRSSRKAGAGEDPSGRRRLLRGALVAAGTPLLGACDRLSRNEAFADTLKSAQRLSRSVHKALAGRSALAQEFTPADIAPHFRSNGTRLPRDANYRALMADGFRGWRLQVAGLVARPAVFTLAELRALPSRTQITRHDCVEGWSAIGKWKGVPLARLLEAVGPLPQARYVVFGCADSMEDGPNDSRYYESVDLDDARHVQTILAYELNDAPLPVENGAPLRARIERQLGYKHAKYLMRIELVESFGALRGGQGGYWEDNGYEWYAGI